jgi:hypothetical protein
MKVRHRLMVKANAKTMTKSALRSGNNADAVGDQAVQP